MHELGEFHEGAIHGTRYDTGVVAYDYARQEWVDTRPEAERDPSARSGAASNPRNTI